MKVENIEDMVRVIHGSFPNSDIFKPDVVKAWQRNNVIQEMDVAQARAVQVNIVNTCDRFPSVNEVVAMYYKLFGKTVLKCDRCYYRVTIGRSYGNVDNSGATANGSNWFFMGAEADGFFGSADIYTPFLTARTGFYCASPLSATNGSLYVSGGYQNSATSFTDFTLTTSTGTITGGTIKVYGYKN